MIRLTLKCSFFSLKFCGLVIETSVIAASFFMVPVKFNEGGGAGKIRVFKSEISDLGLTRFNLFSVFCFKICGVNFTLTTSVFLDLVKCIPKKQIRTKLMRYEMKLTKFEFIVRACLHSQLINKDKLHFTSKLV